ncbi:BLOC-2 complex member HPS5-like isoform X2 [Dysidea avara]|uniref:BLOC-2 complex member HPS5-like isoform X2 n=1 Tax=Dysidea avara TaxID=196820 RepID=UPI00331C4956
MEQGVYSLIEVQDTSSLFDALGYSTRLKYCCVDYSLNHVALGATSGGVYCFRYEDLSYLRVIANKEGGVTLLRFSPDGAVLAVVCGGGHVIFWQLNLEDQQVSKRIHSSSLLKGCVIRDAVWDDKGFRLFYGDEHGRVVVANVPRLSRVLGNKNIFKVPDGVIYDAKCSIVQLSYQQDSLLISSTKKCVIIRPGVIGVIQVGTKPREGNYGACFYENLEASNVVVYSARPGCRVWEAWTTGKVVKTHKFRELIQAASPTPLLGIGKNPQFQLAVDHPVVSNIQLLLVHGAHFLVSWQDSSLYVFDAVRGHLILWTDELTNIVEVAVGNPDSLLVLYDNSNKIAKLSVRSVQRCVQELANMGEWLQAYKMVIHHIKYWRGLCGNPGNYHLVVVTQQIVDNCTDSGEDLQVLQDCVADYTKHEPSPQQQDDKQEVEQQQHQEERFEDDLQQQDTQQQQQQTDQQDEWEGLWVHQPTQPDHVTHDYVITRDEDEPALLLPSDTSGIMDANISIVTKSSGAIMIESLPLVSEGSHELQEVSLVSDNKSHDLVNGSHDPEELHDGSHELTGGSHEPMKLLDLVESHEPIESHESSHELMKSHEFTGGLHEPTRSLDTLDEPLIPASHDPFAGSHDLTEQLFEEDEDTSSYRHRSLTAASASSTPYASLGSTGGGQGDDFEVIPLVTGSKKKRTKKSGKKKKKQQSISDETDSAPPSILQPSEATPPAQQQSTAATPTTVQQQPVMATPTTAQQQEEEQPTAPIVNATTTPVEDSPVQSHKTSPASSPSSSVYGTSNPTQPASELFDGPSLKKRSKPAVILSKVKKSLTSTITENVANRDAGGRSVAMVKGLISSLTGGVSSQSNVTVTTADTASIATTIESNTSDVVPAAAASSDVPVDVAEKPCILSAVAEQLSQETLAASVALNSMETISDHTHLDHTLTKWLAHLEQFWEEEGSHDAIPSSYQLLSNTVQDDIKELLGACLHAEVFFGSHNNTVKDSQEQTEPIESDKDFPDFPNKGLPLWEGLSQFITRYCQMLDICQLRIKLGSCDPVVMTTCWDHMISSMEKCVDDDVVMTMLSAGNYDDAFQSLSTSLEEGKVSPWLPMYMSRLITNFPEASVEACVKNYPYLEMWEVARLYHVIPTYYPMDSDKSSETEKAGYTHYTNYINQLYKTEMIEWACFHDNLYLVLLWLECLLDCDDIMTTESSSSNQMQSLQPHPSQLILDQLINLTINHISVDDRDHVIQLCQDKKYSIGYIQLCLSLRRLKEAFTEILKENDATLLNHPLRWGQLPSNLEEWQLFLECMVEADTSSVRNPEHPDHMITWESVLMQLLVSHGPLQVTLLLNNINMASVDLGSFQCHLNRILVAMTRLQLQQEHLAYEMLGKVDTYLWNPRRNPLGPHAMLLATRSPEVSGDHMIQQGEESLHDIITLEDSECHYGVRVARSETNCPVCSLSLTANLPSSVGLCTFVCGHSYHQQCLPEQACVVCFATSLVSAVK